MPDLRYNSGFNGYDTVATRARSNGLPGLIMRLSGGRIKTPKQVQQILLWFVIGIFLCTMIVWLFGNNPRSPQAGAIPEGQTVPR